MFCDKGMAIYSIWLLEGDLDYKRCLKRIQYFIVWAVVAVTLFKKKKKVAWLKIGCHKNKTTQLCLDPDAQTEGERRDK